MMRLQSQMKKPRIAGVYLNRLKRGIPLQACPTIKFALNDFTITRILFTYLQTDSPYNTYIHKRISSRTNRLSLH